MEKYSGFKYTEWVVGNYTNRGTIIEISEIEKYHANVVSLPCWTSLFRFQEDFKAFVKENKSVAGYTGQAYSDFLWFDIDVKPLPSEFPKILDGKHSIHVEALNKSLKNAQRLVGRILHEYDLNTDYLRCYFSGSKGFHIGIPIEVFDLKPSEDFNLKCKHLANSIARDLGIDMSLYDLTRLFRLPGSVHNETRLYKTEVTANEIMCCENILHIIDVAKTGRKIKIVRLDPDEVSGHLTHLLDDYRAGHDISPVEHKTTSGHNYAAILSGKLEGTSRTQNLVVLASHWASRGIPLSEAITMGKNWDKSNNLGLDADPQYKSQYATGKISGTIEDIYRRYKQPEMETEDEQPTSLVSTRASDMLASNLPKPAMLFDKILPCKGYSVVASFTKEGKTTLATQIILSLLSESDFLVFNFESKANSVVYLFFEMELADFNELLQTQLANWQGTKPDMTKLFLIDCSQISLDTKTGTELIKAKIAEHKPDLVVIDPLMLAVDADINKRETVKNIVKRLRKINDNLCWLIVHHFGKPAGFAREAIHATFGSSGWANFAVSFMGLERYSKKRSPDYKRITFKTRRGRLPEDMCLYLNPMTRLFEVVENPDGEIEKVSAERVRDIFLQNASGHTGVGYSLLKTWVEFSLGVSERTAKNLIKEAVSQKIIFKQPGKFGKYYIELP